MTTDSNTNNNCTIPGSLDAPACMILFWIGGTRWKVNCGTNFYGAVRINYTIVEYN